MLPIYERRYTNDNRVRNCIEKTELYLKGECSLEEIRTAYFSDVDAVVAVVVAAAAAAAAAAADNKEQFKKELWKLIQGLK